MLASVSSPTAALDDQLREIDAVGGLRERLAMVVDPRSSRGLRHSLVSILLITVCALAAGKNGYTAIEAWALDAPAGLLAALDVRFDVFAARYVCPDESTIRVTLGRIDAAVLAATGCAYLADLACGRAIVRHDVPDEREAPRVRASTVNATVDPALPHGFALDGKRLAGARRADGSHVNLLSLVDHATGTTFAQREIGAKTNEIPEARALLADLDVAGTVLTLDALHTQRATAQAIGQPSGTQGSTPADVVEGATIPAST